jgi:hypothetical protein
MSFGLGISFGRLCRLEQQRKESFDTDEPVLTIKTDEYIYTEYKKYDSTCDDIDFPGLRITYRPFSFMDKRALLNLIEDNCV